ncbi:hypothetical protein HAX54_033632, partial [Datura stramonium]|nr:hypothetical protein [Datura stramonium]
RKAIIAEKRRKHAQDASRVAAEDHMEEDSPSIPLNRTHQTKGPGAPSRVRSQPESSLCLSREKRQKIMQSQKVLRGRVFDPDVVDLACYTP